MSKLWGGRFTKETNKLVEEFTASIEFDKRLVLYDIIGSIAHVKMLSNQKILSTKEKDELVQALQEVFEEAKQGKLEFNISDEDIHMNIERRIIELAGDTGKKLHTGRSRNDQVALDMQMFFLDKSGELAKKIVELLETFINLSKQHIYTYMPGFTHMQRAQPTTFSHHIMNYFWKFKRDLERILEFNLRANNMPLGSGAFAGTSFPISQEITANELNFSKVFDNSMDAVSSRDNALELLSILTSVMLNLSRLSEELVLWSSKEFNYIKLDEAFTTGSSIMPQKQNPDVAELIRGKTGRVIGNYSALATTCKALPMAYNKDFQEDKECVFDTVDTLEVSISLMNEMLQTMTVNKDVMKNSIYSDFSNATDVADYLTTLGIPFRIAHDITGKLVRNCQERKKLLNQITKEELSQLVPDLNSDSLDNLFTVLDPIECVNSRSSKGGPSPNIMREQINCALKELNDFSSKVQKLPKFL
ncbi:argininosuccinate lyase [Natranaerobius trueperi]|uniref:Argininosuccinate lyase n=1 Tax=Natranaerobius trueperi TaxID=759412 RepID=A0A226C2Z4_9FIRM|nr:argininosuccinate lyase [Natranaerobius trueperi]OWZ84760.1 argininosuccinate lyase [Natranaerobius trueperi]